MRHNAPGSNSKSNNANNKNTIIIQRQNESSGATHGSDHCPLRRSVLLRRTNLQWCLKRHLRLSSLGNPFWWNCKRCRSRRPCRLVRQSKGQVGPDRGIKLKQPVFVGRCRQLREFFAGDLRSSQPIVCNEVLRAPVNYGRRIPKQPQSISSSQGRQERQTTEGELHGHAKCT